MDESCSIQTLPFSCIKMRNRYQNLLRNKSLIFGGHLSFVMNQSTFDTGIDGMEDKNGQPIGRTNYGVNGEETYRFMGKNVETVEDDVLPSWDDANEGDVIAVFMNFSDYVINTNMEMQVVKWTDHDNNKIKNKCLMVVDGKVADAAGIILVKKGVTAV